MQLKLFNGYSPRSRKEVNKMKKKESKKEKEGKTLQIFLDIICILLSFSYVKQITENGNINFSTIHSDLFLAVGLPMFLLLFNKPFFNGIAYFLTSFVAFLWLQQEVFKDSFLNIAILSFLIPIGFFWLSWKRKLPAVILRGLIYSFWILNIIHALFFNNHDNSLINHSFDKTDATFAIKGWWFMLLFLVLFLSRPKRLNIQIFNKKSAKSKSVKNIKSGELPVNNQNKFNQGRK